MSPAMVRLPLLLASFALTGYAGVWLLQGDAWGVVVWFVGAVVLHDLVLLPLYAALDRAVVSLCGIHRVNYVRVPAFVSALLLLVWFPLILRQSAPYERASGLSIDVFLGRWLLITAALFAASALVFYAVRCLWWLWRDASPPGDGGG